jgi:hypothetical protein
MNKIIYTLASVLFSLQSLAQPAIPNGNFETWGLYNTWTLEPEFWTTDNSQLMDPIRPDSASFEGDLAMRVTPLKGFEGAVQTRASTVITTNTAPAALHFAVKCNVNNDNPDDNVAIQIDYLADGVQLLNTAWGQYTSIPNWTEITYELPPIDVPFNEIKITVTAGVIAELFGGSMETWISVDAMGFSDMISIAEPNLSNFNVFPNPTRDILHLTGQDNTEGSFAIRIIDNQGKVCFLKNNQNFQTGKNYLAVDITKLVPGCYILQLIGQTGSIFSRKIIVE